MRTFWPIPLRAVALSLSFCLVFALPAEAQFLDWNKIIPSDNAAGDRFGHAVDIDGNRAIVGAIDDDDEGDSAGAVYILERQGSTWLEAAKLTPTELSGGDQFGTSVAISGDYAIASHLDAELIESSVFFFERIAGTWTQVARFTDGSSYDRYGVSVDIAGTLAVVGAPYDPSGTGKVYVYERGGNGWGFEDDLTGAAGSRFGESVAITQYYNFEAQGFDDWYIAVGMPGFLQDRGGVSVYRRNIFVNGWIQAGSFTLPTGVAGDRAGSSVAISGWTSLFLAVGAPLASPSGNQSGSAWLWRMDSQGDWYSLFALAPDTPGPGDRFGTSVDVDGDFGNFRAVIGAPYDDDEGSNSGSVFVFEGDADGYGQVQKLTASDAFSNDGFGFAVAIDQSGPLMLVGAPNDDDNGSSSGSVYPFSEDVATSIGGTVYEDLDGNGVKSSEELGLSGWRVYLDLDEDGSFDASEPWNLTDADGRYWILQTPLGSYTVRAELQPDFLLTEPGGDGSYAVQLELGSTFDALDFGVQSTVLAYEGSLGPSASSNAMTSSLDVLAGEEFSFYIVLELDQPHELSAWATAIDIPANVTILSRTVTSPDALDHLELGTGPDNWIVLFIGCSGYTTQSSLVEYRARMDSAGSAVVQSIPPSPSDISPVDPFLLSCGSSLFRRLQRTALTITAGNTPTGSYVEVNPVPEVSLEFSEVISSGNTTVDISTTSPAPDPEGFQLQGTYYDINTTATYAGTIEVCLEYDDTGLSLAEEVNLRLWHFDGGVWVDTTYGFDTDDNIICGIVSALSPFAVAERRPWLPLASSPDLNDPGASVGVSWADYDGDGDDDLYIANDGEANRLIRNDGAGIFTDQTPPELADAGRGSVGVWGDLENDGDLDLYLTNKNEPNRLFRNDGAGAFTDITLGALADAGNGRSAAWVDADNDGYLDLYLTNSGQANVLFVNDGDGNLVANTPAALADPGNSRGVAWGDYDGDGDQDCYITNADGQANRLVRNDGNLIFVDVTSSPLDDTSDSRGAAWGDYDFDEDLDLYVTNEGSENKLFRNDGNGVFVALTGGVLGHVGGSRSVAWVDWNNDATLDLYVTDNTGSNLLIGNSGGVGFYDATEGAAGDTGSATGAGWADYDGDGDLDMYVANDGPNQLLRNDLLQHHHWLHIRLVGTESNRFGVGARIRVVLGGVLTLVREVTAGSGYLSQDSMTAEFGLGSGLEVSLIEVIWPSGIVNTYTEGIVVDRVMTIGESLGGATDVASPDPLLVTRMIGPVPNPFNPRTQIRFELAKQEPVTMNIYDARGRLVRRLLAGESMSAGAHALVWNGRDDAQRAVSSGVYHAILRTPSFSGRSTLVLVR